jgi:carboxymethylenebutenolidase
MRLGIIIICLLGTLAVAVGDAAGDDYVERMAREHRDDAPIASPATAAAPSVPVTGADVRYATVGGHEVIGYLARPESVEQGIPGVIVIHEWWGLNDNIRAMARQLAGQGYAALAVDLYGGSVAETPEKARELMKAAMTDAAAADSNLRQAYAYLADRLKAPRVGSVGWCFGGGWSLETALLFPTQLDAAVIYYGHLENDRTRLATLEVPILGLFGAEDRGIPVADVRAFESTLKALGKDATIVVYPGAGHAFANPSGKGYRPQVAENAWHRTLEFLAAHLKTG